MVGEYVVSLCFRVSHVLLATAGTEGMYSDSVDERFVERLRFFKDTSESNFACSLKFYATISTISTKSMNKQLGMERILLCSIMLKLALIMSQLIYWADARLRVDLKILDITKKTIAM